MTTPIQRAQAKFKEITEIAKRLYDVDLSVVSLQFNLKGRVGGWASAGKGWPRRYSVRLNQDMLLRETDEMVNVTLPHELAHIICFMKPSLGDNHDAGWQRVDRSLGGTGARTHDIEVVYGKGNTYEYTTDRGHKVRLNERLHAFVRAGQPVLFRKGKGTVTLGCAFSIVGVQGRTLTTPIVKQAESVITAPNHRATIEQFVRERMQEIGERFPKITVTKVEATPKPAIAPSFAPGQSKAAISRAIMLAGYQRKQAYETIISAMIAANGYDRQLARATFKANAGRVGIPATFGG